MHKTLKLIHKHNNTPLFIGFISVVNVKEFTFVLWKMRKLSWELIPEPQ